MYILLLIILLLIIYDILITKKENKVKKEIKNKEIKQEETGFFIKKNIKKKDINEDCLYKINENNDNCTLKNGCFKNNECKINISSIENLHPSSFDWSSLNIKY
jgi:hypothetical protein